ncbi:MAG: cyclic pyranopterin monophosphate synthase MoaC [Cyclobacteriaceae bacterium]|jgi:molybdenum cofactor biosynthesis protein MoaC
MVDIIQKSPTHRTAITEARVRTSSPDTIKAVKENTVPKGNVFEFSRAAGLLAIKNTYAVVPDCHPLPIEGAQFNYSIEGLDIIIRTEVQTFYKTGVEVEAMHGAMIAALTIYDMLKPLDKNISIEEVKLLEKRGGKSDQIKH